MLTAPWALLGLISVPILFGIYFFRTRSRRREVSCLFLWVDRNQSHQGGRRIQRLQLPLLLFLELFTLILLTVAATRPMHRVESMGRPTAIILDASYSMTAGFEGDTAQKRAVDDLYRMFTAQFGSKPIGYPVHFIVAGMKPQLLPGRARNAAEAQEILESWTCESPTADLDAAVSLASNISTPGTKILVVTDHAPTGEIAEGRVLWQAYGKPSDNLAIIHASRVFQDEKDRLLLEIANLGEKSQPLRMSIIETKQQRIIFQQESRTLEPGQTHLIRTGIPPGIETLEVRLDKDVLALDNRLTILPPDRRPLRVQLGDLPAELREKVKKAIEATGIASLVQERPEIIFGTLATESPTAWTVHLVSETNSEKVKPFIGPFVVDHSSPLTTGLSLEGVVWSAGESHEHLSAETSVIAAGDVPLLTEQRKRNGARNLTLYFNDRLSTLTSGPAWPILIWNILKYRTGQTTGMAVNNLKLGAEAEFIPAEGDEIISVTPPQGEKQMMKQIVKQTIKQEIPVSGSRSVRIPADQVGVFQISAASGTYEFTVGTLSADESNLVNSKTATFGNWFDEETLRTDFQPLAWLFLLAALTMMTAHLWLIRADNSREEILHITNSNS